MKSLTDEQVDQLERVKKSPKIDPEVLVPYEVITLEYVRQTINKTAKVFLDFETDGFYGEILIAQFFQEEWDKALLVLGPNLDLLMEIISENDTVIQNASYEFSTLQRQTGTRYQSERFQDTLYSSRLHFYKEVSFGLDDTLLYSMGYCPYFAQGLDKKTLQKSFEGCKIEKITKDQLLYAATDVYYLPIVYNICKYKEEDKNYKSDMATLRHCLDWQNNGMPVNSALRLAQEIKNNLEIDEIDLPINSNSYIQVRKYIQDDFPDKHLIVTDKGEPKEVYKQEILESDAKALSGYILQGSKRADDVRRTRRLLKQNNFLEKFDTPDGYIRGIFAPITRSGRLSCKDQNLQQIPRKLKHVFGFTKDQNKVLVLSDFSQAQLRITAGLIGELVMANLFKANKDVHKYVMNFLFEVQKRGDERQITKTCNFNLLFAGSAGMLQGILLKDADIYLPYDEVERLRDIWVDLWPMIKKWHSAGYKAWKKGQAWQTPFGRKYVGKLYTDQLNIMIQGCEADLMKLTKHKLLNEIAHLPDVKLCDVIHDNFILECPNDREMYAEVSDILGNAMTHSWEIISKRLKIKDIPMPVDVHVGYNWGDIEGDDVDNIYNSHYECTFK